MKHQWIVKAALLMVWPLLALLLAAMIAVVLVMAWCLIPFSTVKRKEDGGYTMTLPWCD